MKHNYHIYILLCSDQTLYTGYTNDIERRIETHKSGKWAKYTRGRLPVELVYSESYDTESEARKREYAIKQLTRTQKNMLIKNAH
jgi:putative endonuclease